MVKLLIPVEVPRCSTRLRSRSATCTPRCACGHRPFIRPTATEGRRCQRPQRRPSCWSNGHLHARKVVSRRDRGAATGLHQSAGAPEPQVLLRQLHGAPRPAACSTHLVGIVFATYSATQCLSPPKHVAVAAATPSQSRSSPNSHTLDRLRRRGRKRESTSSSRSDGCSGCRCRSTTSSPSLSPPASSPRCPTSTSFSSLRCRPAHKPQRCSRPGSPAFL